MARRRVRKSRKLGTESLESRQLLHGGALAAGGAPPTTAERVEAAFSRLDTNEDAVLTAEDDISARLWERLSQADTDGNGVSAEELVDHLEARAEEREQRGRGRDMRPEPPSQAERLDRLYAARDADENGLLTEEEVSERTWERISAADTNEDGVSQEELTEYLEAQRAARRDEAFARLDADESGGLTEDEVSPRHWARIVAADADENGSVTQDELAAYREAREAEREAQEEASGEEGAGNQVDVEDADRGPGRLRRGFQPRGGRGGFRR